MSQCSYHLLTWVAWFSVSSVGRCVGWWGMGSFQMWHPQFTPVLGWMSIHGWWNHVGKMIFICCSFLFLTCKKEENWGAAKKRKRLLFPLQYFRWRTESKWLGFLFLVAGGGGGTQATHFLFYTFAWDWSWTSFPFLLSLSLFACQDCCASTWISEVWITFLDLLHSKLAICINPVILFLAQE